MGWRWGGLAQQPAKADVGWQVQRRDWKVKAERGVANCCCSASTIPGVCSSIALRGSGTVRRAVVELGTVRGCPSVVHQDAPTAAPLGLGCLPGGQPLALLPRVHLGCRCEWIGLRLRCRHQRPAGGVEGAHGRGTFAVRRQQGALDFHVWVKRLVYRSDAEHASGTAIH